MNGSTVSSAGNCASISGASCLDGLTVGGIVEALERFPVGGKSGMGRHSRLLDRLMPGEVASVGDVAKGLGRVLDATRGARRREPNERRNERQVPRELLQEA